VRGHDRQIAIGRYFAAYCSSAQRQLRGGRGSVTHAVEAGGCENEPAIGSVSGLAEGRSTMQQLLSIPGTEWLHPRRRQYKSDWVVQILGQKGGLRACFFGPVTGGALRLGALIDINCGHREISVAEKQHSTKNK
jgi:hypothetical protein